MSGQAFVDRLKQKFGDKITGANLDAIDPWIEVSPPGWLKSARICATSPICGSIFSTASAASITSSPTQESGQDRLGAAPGSRLSPVELAA